MTIDDKKLREMTTLADDAALGYAVPSCYRYARDVRDLLAERAVLLAASDQLDSTRADLAAAIGVANDLRTQLDSLQSLLEGEQARLRACDETRVSAEAGRDALQKFKDFVHTWLDTRGVPADPDPKRTADSGCRIGGRLDYLVKNRVAMTPAEVRAMRHKKE